MATGLHSNVVIYDELAKAVFVEQLDKNLNVFNEASNGALRFVSRNMEGYYNKTKFLDRLTGGVSRRDLTSTSAQTATALTMDEIIGVKRFAKWNSAELTLGAIMTSGMSEEAINVAVAKMFADETAKEYVNSAVIALEAALVSDADLYYDYSGTGNLAHAALITGLGKFGDASDRIVCWFGHSKPYFDLMGASLTVSSGNVGPATIFDAQVGTVNRPYIQTDNVNFGNNATPDKYVTFGLQPGAVTITESEMPNLVGDLVTGTEQLTKRYQGEFAYNVELKGEKWEPASATNNPTDAQVGTAANWDPVVASHKDRAGVAIHTT